MKEEIYLIQGTAEAMCTAFGLGAILAEGTVDETTAQVERDIDREHFLGTAKDKEDYLAGCKRIAHGFFAQGHLTAREFEIIIHQFLATDIELASLGQREAGHYVSSESGNIYNANKRCLGFADVDSDVKLSGLAYFLRKDDPTTWVIVLSKNNTEVPSGREIFMLSPVKPKSEQGITITSLSEVSYDLDQLAKKLLDNLKHPVLEAIMKRALNNNGALVNRLMVLSQFARLGVRNDFDERLFDILRDSGPEILQNTPLVALSEKFTLTPEEIKAFLAIWQKDLPDSLGESIEVIAEFISKQNDKKVSEDLNLLTTLHISNISEISSKELVDEITGPLLKYPRLIVLLSVAIIARNTSHLYEDLMNFTADEQERSMARELLDRATAINCLRQFDNLSFSNADIELLIKNKTFCETVLMIEEECQIIGKNLSKNDPEQYGHFLDWEKEYRRSLYTTLCAGIKSEKPGYITRGTLNAKECFSTSFQTKNQQVLDELRQKVLAKFSLSMPNQENVLPLSLIKNAGLWLNEAQRQAVTEAWQDNSSKAFEIKPETILEECGCTENEILSAQKDFELLSQSLLPDSNLSSQNVEAELQAIQSAHPRLMCLLCTSIATRSTSGFDKNLRSFTDKREREMARELLKKVEAVNSLRNLNLTINDDTRKFKDDEIALLLTNKKFLDSVLGVEKVCQSLKEFLAKDSRKYTEGNKDYEMDSFKYGAFQKKEIDYRKTLYRGILKEIKRDPNDPNATSTLGDDIKKAENQFYVSSQNYNVLKLERHHTILRTLKAAITNLLSLVFTLNIANVVNYKTTGKYWFFTDTTSKREIDKVDSKIKSRFEIKN